VSVFVLDFMKLWYFLVFSFQEYGSYVTQHVPVGRDLLLVHVCHQVNDVPSAGISMGITLRGKVVIPQTVGWTRVGTRP